MKGLLLRAIFAIGLLLWAIDMIFPWQKMMSSEKNHYVTVLEKGELVVGTVNNPVYYFIGNEEPQGLEYELSRAFADYLGVKLKIVTLDNSNQLFDALSSGKIDMAAAGLRYQNEKTQDFQTGPGYTSASWQLVYRMGAARPKTFADVDSPVLVPFNEELMTLLTQYRQQAPNLQWQANKNLTQEEILLMVADGKQDYAIAGSIDVASAQQIKPQLNVAFDVSEESSVHWYFSKNTYNELQAASLEFMHTALETGLVARLEEKYFNHMRHFDYVDARTYLNAIENVLPKYIDYFKRYRGDLEWHTLAAIAYQESHWDETATSLTGVRGIMMLTKDTAERMKVRDRTDPEQSIRGGSEYLHMLMRQIPDTVRQEDKIWYALAAYNMGLGHLLDVRRLTKELGGDPDNWLEVKNNLPLLAEKRYYSKLKYGYARGYEAYAYVENIRRYMSSISKHYRLKEIEKAIDRKLIPADSGNTGIKENDYGTPLS
ncbi:murein transglycosylase [Chelonobacter oris]|uniref:Membrane-bound lytic murein transglycosylase F n=1 Tax=Chelonobacter oris TaxID=505317 RepID=A0A0A3ARN5_9PAST|nr:membrane-bound lytic murein transglycosylase MltF [Chelonobacter oris]KGQ69725.1 murein transglycosylase [Chelonobacter oris]